MSTLYNSSGNYSDANAMSYAMLESIPTDQMDGHIDCDLKSIFVGLLKKKMGLVFWGKNERNCIF